MHYNFDEIVDRSKTNSEKWNVEPNELPMWVADMDFKTAPDIVEALEHRSQHGIFGYSYVPDSWKDSICSWWSRRYNFNFTKDDVIFSCGVIPSLSCAVRKFTTPGQKIIIQTPVYNIFFNSIINNGRRVVENPLIYKDGICSMDFDLLEEQVKDPEVTMLILCNPHNPLGHIWDKDSLSRLGLLCASHHVLVISDEIHCDITEPGKVYTPFASVNSQCRDNSITLCAPSKSFNIASIHTSQVIVPNSNLRDLMNRALNTDEIAEPNSYAIDATIAAYNKSEDWLDNLVKYIWENRRLSVEYIESKCKGIKCVSADATYLLWIDVRCLNMPSKDVSDSIRKETGLYLSEGSQYGKGGDGFLRLNIACPRSRLMDGLERLSRGLNSLMK